MPDTSAACGFSPTARTSSPQRVRYTSHPAMAITGYTRYVGQVCANSALPRIGRSDRNGTSTTLASVGSGSMLESRNAASPSTSTLRVRPTTNWSAVSRWLMVAWTSATVRPAKHAPTRPSTVLDVRSYATAPANAPASIIASTEMLSVPARSAIHSPTAANASSDGETEHR